MSKLEQPVFVELPSSKGAPTKLMKIKTMFAVLHNGELFCIKKCYGKHSDLSRYNYPLFMSEKPAQRMADKLNKQTSTNDFTAKEITL